MASRRGALLSGLVLLSFVQFQRNLSIGTRSSNLVEQVFRRNQNNNNDSSQQQYQSTSTNTTAAAAFATLPKADKIMVGYSQARKDRSGAVIQDMLMAHAYAFGQGRLYGDFKYGGACFRSNERLRLQSVHEELIQALGLQDILQFDCPNFNHNTSKATTRRNAEGQEELPILLERKHYKNDESKIWTSEWIQYIRHHTHYPALLARSSTTSTNSAIKNVVVHIRRGDVDPCTGTPKGRLRYLPNSHYLRILDHYVFNNKNHKQDTKVSIYSEQESFEPWTDFNSSSMMMMMNASLHLDTPLKDTWLAMMTADVLILSKSSFSFVPAVLNPHGQVIYTPFWHSSLPGWTVVDSNILNETNIELERMRRKHCWS